MERIAQSGEVYLTFQYKDRDSADMGLYAISQGGRYVKNIGPSFEDSVVDVPGYDGQYYYGTDVKQQTFTLSCFTHNLTLPEYDNLRSWLHPRGVGKLILPDQPYKYYIAKVAEVSPLSAIPLTEGQLIDSNVRFSSLSDQVVYTGNMELVLKTVGSAYAYGFSYFRDDLLYDNDFYYDSGLLYKDVCPDLKYTVSANADEERLKIYNPGTVVSKPVLSLNLGVNPLEANSFIKLENKTTNTTSFVNIGGMSDEVIVDFTNLTITGEDEVVHYGKILGTSFTISPKHNLIFIPDAHEVTTSEGEGEIYNTIYVNNNIASIDPQFLKVSEDMVGRFFSIFYNGGAKILSVDLNENTLTLDSSIRQGAGTYNILPATGGTPAGFPCSYIECDNVIPGSGNTGDVVVVHDIWYIWLYSGWQRTSLFQSKSDFLNELETYETKYILLAATIIDLDEVLISTGNEVSFVWRGQTFVGSSMASTEIEFSILPRYL